MNMKEKLLTNTAVVCVLALLCCLLWGSAFPCIKIGYELFDIAGSDSGTQILFAGCRFTLAGILTVIIGSVLNRGVLLPKKTSLKYVIKLCFFQTVAQYIFFYIGLAHTSGVRASIIEGSNVFLALLFACLAFKLEKLTVRKFLGCLIGFLGVITVNLNGEILGFNLLGDGFIFFSAAAYAVSSGLIKIYSREENPVTLSGWQFFAGGIIMVLAGLILGGKITVVTSAGALMLLYLAFVSAFAYSLWGILLKYNPVSKVAVIGFSNPVFGVILSAVLLGEKNQALSPLSLAALILVCIGIYIVNAKGKESPET
ncbi:MAG: DMT family transporter [Clostridiales bacterium]|nr:DMT family transporter [Clostridiales bacterium]